MAMSIANSDESESDVDLQSRSALQSAKKLVHYLQRHLDTVGDAVVSRCTTLFESCSSRSRLRSDLESKNPKNKLVHVRGGLQVWWFGS